MAVLKSTTVEKDIIVDGVIQAKGNLYCNKIVFNKFSDDIGNQIIENNTDFYGDIIANGSTSYFSERQTTLASSTSAAKIASFFLPKGTYIVRGVCRFGANATGRRAFAIGTTINTITGAAMNRTKFAAPCKNDTTKLAIDTTIQVNEDEGQTWYFNAYQNSGSSLAINPVITIVRMK